MDGDEQVGREVSCVVDAHEETALRRPWSHQHLRLAKTRGGEVLPNPVRKPKVELILRHTAGAHGARHLGRVADIDYNTELGLVAGRLNSFPGCHAGGLARRAPCGAVLQQRSTSEDQDQAQETPEDQENTRRYLAAQ